MPPRAVRPLSPPLPPSSGRVRENPRLFVGRGFNRDINCAEPTGLPPLIRPLRSAHAAPATRSGLELSLGYFASHEFAYACASIASLALLRPFFFIYLRLTTLCNPFIYTTLCKTPGMGTPPPYAKFPPVSTGPYGGSQFTKARRARMLESARGRCDVFIDSKILHCVSFQSDVRSGEMAAEGRLHISDRPRPGLPHTGPGCTCSPA